ncbi:uncharacterized protein LOC116263296 [Nymphaea colorata]|nr:uncharacterized protein LOC116263296 [Nymphaea colorata]
MACHFSTSLLVGVPSSTFNRRGTAVVLQANGSSVSNKNQICDLGSDLASEEALETFLRERRLNGDFISRASDILWGRDVVRPDKSEANTAAVSRQQFQEANDDEDVGGFLKLKKTQEWVAGNQVAPFNKKRVAKERQNDSERRKKLGLLKYDALKREIMFLTLGVGAACSGYCLLTLSVQAAISYASGVLFSCLYLQLLYRHADNISRDSVPQIFMQKKSKKIGIRSDDLKDSFERVLNGSAFALSSPRLVIPIAIYGLWSILHHFSDDSFGFQLVPAMFGMFAYKAAALVQVYRENEDLKFIFPDNQVDPNS